jgi:hypothetical protein
MEKQKMTEIKQQTYILLDTCSYSNLVQRKWSKENQSSFQELINKGAKAEISDLSFVELFNGKKNLSEAKDLVLSLSVNKFEVYGHSEELRDIGGENDVFNLRDDISFNIYKGKLIETRNEFLQPVFARLFIDYVRLLSFVLRLINESFWGPLLILLNCAEENHPKTLSDYIDNVYQNYLKDSKAKNNVLLESSLTLVYHLLRERTPSLTVEDFEKQSKWAKTPNGLSKLTTTAIDIFKKMGHGSDSEIKRLNRFGNLDFLMYIQQKNASMHDGQSNLQFYAIDYVAINAGFCPGRLQFNDLTDLYNFSVSGDKDTEFVYFTDERRWNDFRNYVSRTRPDLLSNANQFLVKSTT